MEKIKIKIDRYEALLLLSTILAISKVPVNGMEVERMVLIEWYGKNVNKFNPLTPSDHVRITFSVSQAMSFRRILMGLDLPQESHIDRQNILSLLEPKLLPYEHIHSIRALG